MDLSSYQYFCVHGIISRLSTQTGPAIGQGNFALGHPLCSSNKEPQCPPAYVRHAEIKGTRGNFSALAATGLRLPLSLEGEREPLFLHQGPCHTPPDGQQNPESTAPARQPLFPALHPSETHKSPCKSRASLPMGWGEPGLQ